MNYNIPVQFHIVPIPTFTLLRYSALGKEIWAEQEGLLSSHKILKLVREKNFEPKPYHSWSREADHTRHERRVAYLVTNPDPNPIQVEADLWSWRGVEVGDGNHRLAAALIRRDPVIAAEVSGQVEILNEHLAEDVYSWKKTEVVRRAIVELVGETFERIYRIPQNMLQGREFDYGFAGLTLGEFEVKIGGMQGKKTKISARFMQGKLVTMVPYWLKRKGPESLLLSGPLSFNPGCKPGIDRIAGSVIKKLHQTPHRRSHLSGTLSPDAQRSCLALGYPGRP